MTKVKVMFELDPEDWHGCPVETMWAELADRSDGGKFRLLNSPFFTRGVNHQDVVEATFVEGSHLVFLFKNVAERGGHSTYMILAKKDEPRLDMARGRASSGARTVQALRSRESTSPSPMCSTNRMRALGPPP